MDHLLRLGRFPTPLIAADSVSETTSTLTAATATSASDLIERVETRVSSAGPLGLVVSPVTLTAS